MSAPIIIGSLSAGLDNKQPLTLEEISENLPYIKKGKLIIINLLALAPSLKKKIFFFSSSAGAKAKIDLK
jgi:hypothetical protein